MAHYARVNVQMIVTKVIVAEQEFIDALPDAGSWVQTSYNTRGGKHYNPETGELSADQTKALRKNYAGIGFKYDSDRDAFIPPRPFASWNLVESTCWWEAPIAAPELSEEDIAAGKYYIWDEDTYQADNTQGWILIDPTVA
jgi:hypothetical protein